MVVTRSQSRLLPPAAETQNGVGDINPTPHEAEDVRPTTSRQATAEPARTGSVLSCTNRSSAMITARKLAVEAQHARHIARLEMATREAENAVKRLELERKAAELELKASLAAIEVSKSDKSSRPERSHGRSLSSVNAWLDEVHNNSLPDMHNTMNASQNNQDNIVDAAARPTSYDHSLMQPIIMNSSRIGLNNSVLSSQVSLGQGYLVSPGGAVQHQSTQPVQARGTNIQPDTSLGKREDSGQDSLTRLAHVFEKVISRIDSNGRKKSIINLPIFDGKSPLDWLIFKRAFLDSATSYSEAENLSRLSVALKGAAREAVSMLLATTQQSKDVIRALDTRFGRPEQIVLQEVASIRALPKLTNDLKELTVFASRVRNCVEVVRLLDQTDYLRSPELYSALMVKLHPLLRSRWIDYAASHAEFAGSGCARLELFSDFLTQEVDLHVRFGTLVEHTPGHLSRERAHSVAEYK